MGEIVKLPVGREPYINRVQLAHALGMSTKWVDNMVRQGMPNVKWGERSRRFLFTDVEAWLKAREQKRESA